MRHWLQSSSLQGLDGLGRQLVCWIVTHTSVCAAHVVFLIFVSISQCYNHRGYMYHMSRNPARRAWSPDQSSRSKVRQADGYRAAVSAHGVGPLG